MLLSNLSFPSTNIFSWFFLFFFIIDFCFLIPAVTAKMLNSTVELIRPTGTQTNEANAEIEMQTVTVATKISKFSIYFKYLHVFLYF